MLKVDCGSRSRPPHSRYQRSRTSSGSADSSVCKSAVKLWMQILAGETTLFLASNWFTCCRPQIRHRVQTKICRLQCQAGMLAAYYRWLPDSGRPRWTCTACWTRRICGYTSALWFVRLPTLSYSDGSLLSPESYLKQNAIFVIMASIAIILHHSHYFYINYRYDLY